MIETADQEAARLPNFLIIGAAKCATRWMCRCLTEHPQVFIPVDEPFHFCRNYDPADPLPAWYRRLFEPAGDKPVIGENSNTYISHRMVPARLHGALPEAKLIVVMRNPIDRAYSDYGMHLRRGGISRDLGLYLDPDRAINNDFLEKGFYLEQIERFMKFYPRQRFCVVLYDDLRRDPLSVYRTLFGFLGVDPSFEPASLERKVNTAKDKVFLPQFKHTVNQSGVGRWAWDLGRRIGIRTVARKVMARSYEHPPLTDELRAKLRLFYRDETVRLADWLGRDLTHWIEPAGPRE